MKIEFNVQVLDFKIIKFTDGKVRFNDGYADNGLCSYFLSSYDSNNNIGIYGPFDYNIALVIMSVLTNVTIKEVNSWWDSKTSSYSLRHYNSGVAKIAIGVIDCCLLDLAAKQNNKPVFELFNKRPRNEVEVYWSCLNSPKLDESALDIALEATSSGYSKQKWGTVRRQSISQVLDYISRLSEIVPSNNIMYDFKFQSTPNDILESLKELSELNLLFIEEPFDYRSYIDNHKLKFKGLNLAYGEHTYSEYEVHCLLSALDVTYFQPDVVWFGGIIDVINCLSKFKINKVAPHGGSFIPAVHLAMICGESIVPLIEYNEKLEKRRQFFYERKILPDNALITKPSYNGWGIEINERRAVESFKIPLIID